MSDKNNNQIQIDISEEIGQGTYANLAVISHSSSEFVLDFVRVMPNIPKAKVQSRIILTPQHAKRLLQALEDNIDRFESQMGEIKVGNTGIPPMNFNVPPGQA